MLTQAPAICAGYQTGTYNLTIFDNSSVVVDHFGPMKYTQENNSERTLVVKVLRSSLMPGSQYEVEVTVESLGIFRSQRKSVSKLKSVVLNYDPSTHTQTHFEVMSTIIL